MEYNRCYVNYLEHKQRIDFAHFDFYEEAIDECNRIYIVYHAAYVFLIQDSRYTEA